MYYGEVAPIRFLVEDFKETWRSWWLHCWSNDGQFMQSIIIIHAHSVKAIYYFFLLDTQLVSPRISLPLKILLRRRGRSQVNDNDVPL